MEKQANIFDVLGYPDDWYASDTVECTCACANGTNCAPQDGQDDNQAISQLPNQLTATDTIPVLPGQLVWCRSLRH